MIDLPKIKEDFSLLVKEAQPWTLTQFVMWLDLKLSEFKIKGYMVLDHNIKTKPKWLVEEGGSGEITPSPAPCPQCSKPSRDERQFYSDIHATPSELQNRSVTKNVSQDDDNIRGEVGVIDLSEGVVQKQNVNRTQAGTHRSPHIQSYRQISHQDFNKGDSAKRQRTDVIEIDPPVSKEKRFVPRPFHKTSTPMARSRFQQLQQRPRPQRPVLSTGSTIYTSTISQTTPSFSTGYSGQTQRMPAASRSFALGAPPVVTSTMTTSFTEYENLENLITQAIQNTEPINISSQPTVSSPAGDRSTMLAGYSQSQSSISPTKSSFSSTNVEGQRNTSQTSSEIQISPQTSFDNVIPATDNTQVTFGSQQQNQYSTPVTTQAVPVALHAIGDVINRDNSSSSLPGSSDYEITEIKIESDPEDSMNESSITDTSVGNISQPLDTSQSLPQMQGSSFSLDASGLPKPGLVDPDTAKTYQMVELVAGSGVYVYEKNIQQAFKIGTESQTGTYSGEKMARYLLNVFWTRKELVGSTLSKVGRGKKILNQQIIEAILEFCVTNSRHKNVCRIRTVLHRSLSSRNSAEKLRLERLQFRNPNLSDKDL